MATYGRMGSLFNNAENSHIQCEQVILRGSLLTVQNLVSPQVQLTMYIDDNQRA